MSNVLYERTNLPGLRKNQRTGVIINDNVAQLDANRARRSQLREKRQIDQDMDSLRNKITAMENDILEIKILLKNIKCK